MRFPKTKEFHSNICMKMLNVILNIFGYYMQNSNNFLNNDIINDCTTDIKDQESIQLSITSDKGHHMGT